MKIGVYNRYWNTFGGGEKHIGAVVEVLSRDHEVELISVGPVDWEQVESRLRLDLSRCTKKEWPGDSCAQLSLFSSDYELFINSTYGSSMMPRSRLSAYMCFFPHRVDRLTTMRMRTSTWLRGLLSRNLFICQSYHAPEEGTIVPVCGVFPVEGDGRSWLSVKSVLAISGCHSKGLRIPLWPGSYNGIRSIRVDGQEVRWHVTQGVLHVDVHDADFKKRLIFIDSEPIAARDIPESIETRRLGACVDTRRLNWVEDFWLQGWNPGWRESLRRYDLVISNSSFTSNWIKKRWQLPSVELPPPIDTATFSFPCVEKEKIILSVGRFFFGGHNKKHTEMALAFIRMRREGVIPDGWRLVMVGSRHRDHPKHIAYFRNLEEICRDHEEIEIRPDLPYSELLDYYRCASIYWHAAGWGERVALHPERFEHFGITTCEAMASGCVPVVYDAGGQREIVFSEEVGFHYSSYETLVPRMEALTRADPESLRRIAAKARESIGRFSLENFPDRVRDVFRGICY
ncbi:glycosyltransferase [Desulfomicrobium escambiense]|uniref:glycosyltransferase n=1 Tax=Desulfomicrobium escambiense TaxID=29503 RepID=UPI0004021F69|nr:glycosyltransferase [Desulfomicrobium escambiense]